MMKVILEDSGSGLRVHCRILLFLLLLKDWLQVVVPHLVLTDCIEANEDCFVFWPSSGCSGLQEVQQAILGPWRVCQPEAYYTLVCWLWPQVGCCTTSPR